MNFLIIFLSLALISSANGDDTNTKSTPCDYSALYNFGDSNSDTGGIASAFYPPVSPFGETYFHMPVGRASDGRLIIDFLAENLGLPYLSPYLDSVGSNFQHGANFATGGATILQPRESWFESGVSPFNMDVQVEHFNQLKDKAAYFYNQSKDECFIKRLPKPENLSKALFTFDIGQNDIAAIIRNPANQSHQSIISNAVNQFIAQVRILHSKGGRTFWIHNTGPIGCLPAATSKVQNPGEGYLDENGCVKSQNELARHFNKQLGDEVVKLRTELPQAAIIYVDIYTAKYGLISKAKDYGFEDGLTICCGYHGIGYDVWCGNKGYVNGSEVFAGSCTNPSGVISWDAVHYTEAANRWIANRVVNGSLSDPPVGVATACHAKP